MPEHPYQNHRRWISLRSAGVLDNPDARAVDRCAAAFALGRRGGARSFWALAKHAYDEDYWVRTEVVRALALAEDARAFPVLLDLLHDADELVRHETRLSIKSLLTHFAVAAQYDLLRHFDEGSARARGPLMVAAGPTDIALSVWNRKILEGVGIDAYLDVDGRNVRLHDGRWTFAEPGPNTVHLVSRDEASGIEFHLTIACADDEFSFDLSCLFPEPTTVSNPTCDLFFVAGFDGKPLLPTNGLQPGPSRRAVLGNEILLRAGRIPDGPRGFALDITGSRVIRQVAVNPEVNVRLIQLTPPQPTYELGPGLVDMLRGRLRLFPTTQDFDAAVTEYAQRHRVVRGDLTLSLIGGALRLETSGRNVLEGYGLFLDLVAGGVHHTTFGHPVRAAKVDDQTLAVTFDLAKPALHATGHVSCDSSGGAVVSVAAFELGGAAESFKIGLLVRGAYAQWSTGGDLELFDVGEAGSTAWAPASQGSLAEIDGITLRATRSADLPALHATFAAPGGPAARYAVQATDAGSNQARAIELRLDLAAGDDPRGARLTLELGP